MPELTKQLRQEVPEYFKKKKASQKRRRQEKHELIKKNRKELVKIFGNAIFRSGWPVSREEIKHALGIKEELNKIEELGDFMEQVESEKEKEKEKEQKPEQVSVQLPEPSEQSIVSEAI